MIIKLGLILLALIFYVGCTGVPKGLEPVSEFYENRYLGKWYKIAQLDHSFKRNLSNVTAEYTKTDKDKTGKDEISVLNQGYNEKTIMLLNLTVRGIAMQWSPGRSAPTSGYCREPRSFMKRSIQNWPASKAAEWGFDTIELIRAVHDRTAKNLLPGEKAEMRSKAAGKLTPCSKSPNCVSSLAEDKEHFITPIPYSADNTMTQHKLLEILNSFERVRVVSIEGNYIHVEFVSSVFRFVDDVEFYLDDAEKVIQVKSASRTGYSDFGVNRRRVEMIRKKFEAGATG